MTNDIRKQRPNYYDDLNFPHGFRRSGLFTILEAEIFIAKRPLNEGTLRQNHCSGDR